MDETPKKVILVEDNTAEAKLTKIAFSGKIDDAELIHCSNGEQFINFLQETDLASINYVMLDLNMPRLSGTEVLQRMSQHTVWRRIPTIIFTSSAFEKDIQKCYDLGANAYVVKPVEFDQLEARLLSIHEFWSKTNHLPDLSPPTSML